MMLELSPDKTFGVLSPAFKGCERDYAIDEYSKNGCNFLSEGLCKLHGTGFEPIECRFCHHTRVGQGIICHLDIERDWNTDTGQKLVLAWSKTIMLHNKKDRIIM
jgi:hypothetical protein